VIAALPFTDTLDTTEATIGPEDDAAAALCGLAPPYPKSVWYRYTPSSDQVVLIDTAGSSYSVAGGVGTDDFCVTTFLSSGGFWAQAGQTYWIAFVDSGAGTGGSLQLSIDINHPPVCKNIAISVETGKSVEVPFPDCVDADDDDFGVYIEDEPAHGIFDYDTGLYTPSAGFVGKDSMTFRAYDSWDAESELGLITITVTSAPSPPPQPSPQPQPNPPPQPDVTAPTLELVPPSALTLRTALRRGLRFAVTSNEAGRLVVRAFVSRKTARRLKINRNARGPVVVGRLARDIAAGEAAVKVKLSRKARSKLRHATSVKMRIVAKITDAAGNARTEALSLTLGARAAASGE
jgi:Bacterial Ig domain